MILKILWGEFIFYMRPELDKQINMNSKDTNQIYRQEIIALIESLNLADACRINNHNIRRYTWHSRGKSSRLFFSDHLLNDINKCIIHSGLHSDYSIIKLELNRDKLNRGRVF